MAILMIALAHAVPVFLTGLVSRKVNGVWIAAIVMTFVAFSTGSAKFLVWDLAAIVLGAYATIEMLKRSD